MKRTLLIASFLTIGLSTAGYAESNLQRAEKLPDEPMTSSSRSINDPRVNEVPVDQRPSYSKYKQEREHINDSIKESTGVVIDSDGAAGGLGAESSGGLRGGAAMSIDQR